MQCADAKALFTPQTSTSMQKRRPYTENLNSEMSADSKNASLHCGGHDRLSHDPFSCINLHNKHYTVKMF